MAYSVYLRPAASRDLSGHAMLSAKAEIDAQDTGFDSKNA